MICYNCQKDILAGSRYCYHCGAAQKPLTAPPAPPRRPLRRSRKNKAIAGVCAGFAEYLDLDISLVRVVWLLVAVLGGGAGLIAYLICWIVIPLEEEQSASPVPASPPAQQ
ncbi:MAG: PspC domain-containing protein [Candidatus Acidoferrales bacterium]